MLLNLQALQQAIILGGAQLGLHYGMEGRFLSGRECYALLQKAYLLGFDSLDLAWAYGCAEPRVAMFLRNWQRLQRSTACTSVAAKSSIKTNIKHCHLGTKISCDEENIQVLQARIRRSKRLFSIHTAKLDYVLLHSITAGPNLCRQLWMLRHSLQDNTQIGVSLYYPKELEFLLTQIERQSCPPIQLVQLPYSLADRRFAPYFDRLSNLNIGIQARSLYLQGLLLCRTHKLAELVAHKIDYFLPLLPLLQGLETLENNWGNITNIRPERQDLLLLFALGHFYHAPQFRLVLGVSRPAEVLQLYRSLQRIATLPPPAAAELVAKLQNLEILLQDIPEQILVPSCWPS